jgi:hypothetical protein
MAWQSGPAAEAACGAGAGRAPDALTMWSPRGGHAHGDKVSQKRQREHREGGGNAPDEVVAVRAGRAGVEQRRRGDVPRWRRCPDHGWRWWRGPAVLEGKGEGEAHATCEPRCTEDLLTEEVETRRRGWLGLPVARR